MISDPIFFHYSLYSLLGKDVAKLLGHHVQIFGIIPGEFTRKEDHRLLFATLALIFKKTRLSRFLSESERNDLETNILNLSTIVHLKFPNMNITLKMHDVLGKGSIKARRKFGMKKCGYPPDCNLITKYKSHFSPALLADMCFMSHRGF